MVKTITGVISSLSFIQVSTCRLLLAYMSDYCAKAHRTPWQNVLVLNSASYLSAYRWCDTCLSTKLVQEIELLICTRFNLLHRMCGKVFKPLALLVHTHTLRLIYHPPAGNLLL